MKYDIGWNELNRRQKASDAGIGLLGALAMAALLLAYAWLFRFFLIIGCQFYGACALR